MCHSKLWHGKHLKKKHTGMFFTVKTVSLYSATSNKHRCTKSIKKKDPYKALLDAPHMLCALECGKSRCVLKKSSGSKSMLFHECISRLTNIFISKQNTAEDNQTITFLLSHQKLPYVNCMPCTL